MHGTRVRWIATCPALARRLGARLHGAAVRIEECGADGAGGARVVLTSLGDLLGSASRAAPSAALLVAVARSPCEREHALALGRGADDLLDEAWGDTLLRARVAVVARRAAGAVPALPVLRVGPWSIDAERHVARADCGRTARLTGLEMRVLLELCRHAPGAATDGHLRETVFGCSGGTATHTLQTHVYRLRRKLETDPRRPAPLIRRDGGYALGAGAL